MVSKIACDRIGIKGYYQISYKEYPKITLLKLPLLLKNILL